MYLFMSIKSKHYTQLNKCSKIKKPFANFSIAIEVYIIYKYKIKWYFKLSYENIPTVLSSECVNYSFKRVVVENII